MKLIVQNLGLMAYEKAFLYQESILQAVQSGADDHLLLLEHPKVITKGINAKAENVLYSDALLSEMGFEVIQTRRGGDVTYHGPGQIVGYTIFNIKKNHGGSVKRFVFTLEQLFIDLLKAHYEVEARRDDINSGVFIGDSKIVAIGLSVIKGVTMHGFAFNVNTNLDDYKTIVPCGLHTKGVTSLEVEAHKNIDIESVKKQVETAFVKRFGYEYGDGDSVS